MKTANGGKGMTDEQVEKYVNRGKVSPQVLTAILDLSTATYQAMSSSETASPREVLVRTAVLGHRPGKAMVSAYKLGSTGRYWMSVRFDVLTLGSRYVLVNRLQWPMLNRSE
jgi:hypothetical protein